MNIDALLGLLAIGAFCLWATLLLFTLIDHFVYRGTYGHFLSGLQSLRRRHGAGHDGHVALRAYMQAAKTRYLAAYLARADSDPVPARLAADAYIEREGVEQVLMQAATGRRRPRVVALYALTRVMHRDVLPLLETALAERHPVLAYAALDMLGLCDSIEAAEALLRALDAGVLPASRISAQLERFRTDLGALLISRLRGGPGRNRYWDAYLLGKGRYGTEADAVLTGLLSDPDAAVRKTALASLAEIGAPDVQRQATGLLSDPVFYVRTQAIRILSGFRNADAVHALAGALADGHDAVRLAAQKALVSIEDAAPRVPAGDGVPHV
ncbi:hypothetical protein GCM10010960_06870 [Arenimonas maotaiensis]|uniref:HEAT repeat domain-containing protein n=1 Tax=Arenimonas maotaiensis TaxID=1446479 RepID=A0A917CIF7_9GAMM|nr:HEAT repeat domain-containing protein [Arenimonas maotaiensis]GGF87561.1 hypothetical protein GCM10010960_06870 [Arenimonas maotaiensis]